MLDISHSLGRCLTFIIVGGYEKCLHISIVYGKCLTFLTESVGRCLTMRNSHSRWVGA